MSGPTQPDLAKTLFEGWLEIDHAAPVFTELCMWLLGCLVNGGSIDLSVYTDEEQAHINDFIFMLRRRPEWPLLEPYVVDREFTENDIRSLRVTCKLLG